MWAPMIVGTNDCGHQQFHNACNDGVCSCLFRPYTLCFFTSVYAEAHLPGDRAFVGSCGMYVFKVKALEELLSNKKIKDLGRELIPQAVSGGYKARAERLC